MLRYGASIAAAVLLVGVGPSVAIPTAHADGSCLTEATSLKSAVDDLVSAQATMDTDSGLVDADSASTAALDATLDAEMNAVAADEPLSSQEDTDLAALEATQASLDSADATWASDITALSSANDNADSKSNDVDTAAAALDACEA